MKTIIEFLNAGTGERDRCGDPLEIEVSSRALGWEGVLVEQGWSPYFYPSGVTTHEFYFAMDLGPELHWTAEQAGAMAQLVTIPGDIWVNPPGAPFTHVVSEVCSFVILTIDPNRMFRSFHHPSLVPDLEFLTSYNIRDAVISSFVEMLFIEVRRGGSSGPTFVDHLVDALGEYYVRHYSNYQDLVDRSGRPGGLDDRALAAVREFFLNNLGGNVGIEEAATHINMSKFYFLKEFKRRTGVTPYQYLLRLKAEQAARTLCESDMPLAEIAQSLGFSDQSHFTHAFKRHYHTSPGQYRRSGRVRGTARPPIHG